MKPFLLLLIWGGFLTGILFHALSLWWGFPVVGVLTFFLVRARGDITYGIVILFALFLGWMRWWPLPLAPDLIEKVTCRVSEVKSSYVELTCDPHRYMLYTSRLEENLMEGMMIEVSGKVVPLRPQSTPNQFDFAMYQTRLGIQGVIHLSDFRFVDATPTWAASTRHALLSRLPEEARGWVNWILFGEKVEGPLNDAIRQFSLIDLMVVSGLHIHFLATLLLQLLSRGQPKTSDHVVVFILLLPLAQLMGWPLSMMRSLFALGLGALLAHFHSKWHPLDQLAVIGVLFLMYNPRWIFHTGYQFSFLASFWIAFQSPFVHRFPQWSHAALTNGLITLGLLPLLLTNQFEISLWTPILHLLLSPIILGLFALSLLSLIGVPISLLVVSGFEVMEHGLHYFHYVPMMIPTGAPTLVWNISWWIVFLLWLSWYQIRYKKRQLLSGITLGFLFIYQVVHPQWTSHYEVIFIDVDQGDATLIITPHQDDVILIDTGGSLTLDIALTRLIPYFKSRRIDHVDAVFITHDDFDHNGALSSLQTHFPVDQVFTNSTVTHYPFDTIELINYNPLHPQLGDDNDRSMVIGFAIDTMDYLIMGDASVAVEHALIAREPTLQADILRIGHHGSKTSTSEELLAHLHPQLAIISVGEFNRYGHPHEVVLDRLQRFHIPAYSTADYGTLQILQKNGNVTLRGTFDLV